jgi:hypothetical protein
MDMEQPNTCPEFQGAGKGKLRTPLDPLREVHPVLAHDVIHHQCDWDIFHVV